MPKAKLATPNTWRPRFQLGVDALICFQLGIAKNAPSFIQRRPDLELNNYPNGGSWAVGRLANPRFWPTGQPDLPAFICLPRLADSAASRSAYSRSESRASRCSDRAGTANPA